MMRGKFIENETGVVVDVQSVFAWPPHEQVLIVGYPITLPDGSLTHRKYGVPVSTFEKLFTMCPNQQIIVNSFGNVYDRPTEQQRSLTHPEEPKTEE
jgi:hypothetical protein